MNDSKYWYAYSRQREAWRILDLGRFAYPVDWRGSAFLLAALLAPIGFVFALMPFLLSLSVEAAAVIGVGIIGGSTLAGILVTRVKTDPERSIEDYRARSKGER